MVYLQGTVGIQWGSREQACLQSRKFHQEDLRLKVEGCMKMKKSIYLGLVLGH